MKLVNFSMLLLSLTCSVSSASAQQEESCQELWVRRNAIFKMAGYCFKTPRAAMMFGNDGCHVERIADVPLSEADKNLVASLSRQEAVRGCDVR